MCGLLLLREQCEKLRLFFGLRASVGNFHRSAGPMPTTLEEDWKLFVDFSLILCLWFEIHGVRTYNLFNWVSNTAEGSNIRSGPATFYIFLYKSVFKFLKFWAGPATFTFPKHNFTHPGWQDGWLGRILGEWHSAFYLSITKQSFKGRYGA